MIGAGRMSITLAQSYNRNATGPDRGGFSGGSAPHDTAPRQCPAALTDTGLIHLPTPARAPYTLYDPLEKPGEIFDM